MHEEMIEIVKKGDQWGNEMIFRVKIPSGLEILGLGTRNFYGGEWDLGPTWNYLVLADTPFLVDTGRSGTSQSLIEMMAYAGFSAKDLGFIMLSHGHEDHDGGLADIAKLSGADIRAHSIYKKLVTVQPDKAPEKVKKHFPPSCWHCFMPDSFTEKNCLGYHRERSELTIQNIGSADNQISDNIYTTYLPGHSPDAISISLSDEAFLVGDNILPGITPAPSCISFQKQLKDILSPEDTGEYPAFGLEAYLISLNRFQKLICKLKPPLILPGHRLYHRDQWNLIDPQPRIAEIIDHHINRCADILNIIKDSPKTVREIATTYFPETAIKGPGIYMAENEINSHLEFLLNNQDAQMVQENLFTGQESSHFESHIYALSES